MNRLFVASVFVMLLLACGNGREEPGWQVVRTISLDSVNPIGLSFSDEGLWLSDGDRNRLVLTDRDGNQIRTVDSLDRPMHIATDGKDVWVPLYGRDTIIRISGQQILPVRVTDSLDAPAGVSVLGKEIAIADFYNHRVLYSGDGSSFQSIGAEGKEEGQFYYPTDVQLSNDQIWVADAYNNRIQVFSKDGAFVRAIGADQKMNAATGLFLSDTEVFVTDFENNRVLIFTHEGRLKQTLKEGLDKPIDLVVDGDLLYISNYRRGSLQVLEKPSEK